MKYINKIKSLYEKYAVWINILSVMLAIGGIFLTLYISKQPVKLPQKELTCTLVDTKNLILRLTNDDKFKILYGPKGIKNPYLTIINIHNSGLHTIDNSDFKIPFSIQFTGSEQILSINIDKASNQHIIDEIIGNSDLTNQKLMITDFMLNADESFNINIISDGKISNIQYDFRLAGISELNLIKNYESQYFVVRRKSREESKLFPIFIMGTVVIIVTIVIIFLTVEQKKLKKQRKKFIEQYYSILQEEHNNNQ